VPELGISRYLKFSQKCCCTWTSAKHFVYLNLNLTFHVYRNSATCVTVPGPQPFVSGTWNSAIYFSVPETQPEIPCTCTAAKYFWYLYLNQIFHCIWNSARNFAVPEPQPHISRLQKLSHVCHGNWTSTICLGYLKLSHLFSGTWTSARYLTPC